MRNIIDCVNAFLPLLHTEYEIILGRKGVSVELKIVFKSNGIAIFDRQTRTK